MGWVVKTWRVEEELRSAERELRRARRAAARELDDAAAHLDALEAFGVRTLELVGRRRAAGAPAPEPLTIRATGRPRRASLRDSPLDELFRATAAR